MAVALEYLKLPHSPEWQFSRQCVEETEGLKLWFWSRPRVRGIRSSKHMGIHLEKPSEWVLWVVLAVQDPFTDRRLGFMGCVHHLSALLTASSSSVICRGVVQDPWRICRCSSSRVGCWSTEGQLYSYSSSEPDVLLWVTGIYQWLLIKVDFAWSIFQHILYSSNHSFNSSEKFHIALILV